MHIFIRGKKCLEEITIRCLLEKVKMICLALSLEHIAKKVTLPEKLLCRHNFHYSGLESWLSS